MIPIRRVSAPLVAGFALAAARLPAAEDTVAQRAPAAIREKLEAAVAANLDPSGNLTVVMWATLARPYMTEDD